MKTFYIFFIALLAATSLRAQTQTIPAIASSTNVEKSSMGFSASNADDSIFNHIQILPNLAMGRITVQVSDANVNVIQQGECVIYNSGGKPVAKSPFTTGTTQLYVTNLPAGMYFLKLMQRNGESATRKFVVVR